MLTVIKFVSYDDSGKLPQAPIGGLGGWFNGPGNKTNSSWLDYLNAYEEESRPYLEALRVKIVTDKIRNGGFWHQKDGAPVFSDGTSATFSLRAWGDLMAAIWSDEDKEAHSYCDFAWEG